MRAAQHVATPSRDTARATRCPSEIANARTEGRCKAPMAAMFARCASTKKMRSRMKAKIEIKKPVGKFDLTKETIKNLTVKTNMQAGKPPARLSTDSVDVCCA